MYFKNEPKYSKRSDHVTDDVMSIFWSWKKKYQVEYCFPANFHCHMMKRRLFKALGLVWFFGHVHRHLKFKMPDVNWLLLNASHNQNLKYAICFKLDNELLSQQQKKL